MVDTFDEKERVSYDDIMKDKLKRDALEDQRKLEMRDKVRRINYHSSTIRLDLIFSSPQFSSTHCYCHHFQPGH